MSSSEKFSQEDKELLKSNFGDGSYSYLTDTQYSRISNLILEGALLTECAEELILSYESKGDWNPGHHISMTKMLCSPAVTPANIVGLVEKVGVEVAGRHISFTEIFLSKLAMKGSVDILRPLPASSEVLIHSRLQVLKGPMNNNVREAAHYLFFESGAPISYLESVRAKSMFNQFPLLLYSELNRYWQADLPISEAFDIDSLTELLALYLKNVHNVNAKGLPYEYVDALMKDMFVTSPDVFKTSSSFLNPTQLDN